MLLSTLKPTIMLLLAICASGAPSALENRATTFPLYAYGANGDDIGGMRVFEANGMAYIGKGLTNGSTSADVTFEPGTTNSNWTVSSSNNTAIVGMQLYINPTSNANVGFTSSPSTSQTTTGFKFFEQIAFWVSSTGDWESSFYATPTGQTGTWNLQWFADRSDPGSSIAVALKKIAPAPSSAGQT